MFFVYILKSIKDSRYYIGQTENLEQRLKKHNCGHVKSTRNRRPFILIYKAAYETRQEAYRHEQEIKKMKGGIQFKQLIDKVINS